MSIKLLYVKRDAFEQVGVMINRINYPMTPTLINIKKELIKPGEFVFIGKQTKHPIGVWDGTELLNNGFLGGMGEQGKRKRMAHKQSPPDYPIPPAIRKKVKQ